MRSEAHVYAIGSRLAHPVGPAVISSTLAWHAVRRRRVLIWLAFIVQCAVAISIQVVNDVSTGYFSHYGPARGLANAHRVVRFEMAHHLWIEPASQMFFRHTHHVLDFTITWSFVSDLIVNLYVFGHALITLFVAMWVWVYRRRFFPLIRNTFFLTNAIAWFFYDRFPVAPPRLTSNLTYRRHPYTFLDPLYGVINGANIPVRARFNEFSAVPSIHIGWATIVAAALILLTRPLWIKVLAAFYPFLVLTVIVVTGNHYVFDGIVAIGDVGVAGACAFGLEFPRRWLVGMFTSRILPWLTLKQRLRLCRKVASTPTLTLPSAVGGPSE